MPFLKRKKSPVLDIEPKDTSLSKEALIFIWEIFKVIVISLAIIIPVRYFLIQPFYVKGASMEPNFYDHEYLIINEISYRFSEPQRGEVVVFKYPLNPKDYFIKRIIGLPGEKIEIRDGRIYIYNKFNPQGKVLEEDYLSDWVVTPGQESIQLGTDEYYLLGDNRVSSMDSRVFGPVKQGQIIGKVLFRGWPLARVGLVAEVPLYNL